MRNLEELEKQGPLRHDGAMVEIGSGAQREVQEYWLNEGGYRCDVSDGTAVSGCELLNPEMITVPMAKLKHVDARVNNRITTNPKDGESCGLMTVAEFIEQLRQYPQDAEIISEVVIRHENWLERVKKIRFVGPKEQTDGGRHMVKDRDSVNLR
jgi:hypothetical protein